MDDEMVNRQGMQGFLGMALQHIDLASLIILAGLFKEN